MDQKYEIPPPPPLTSTRAPHPKARPLPLNHTTNTNNPSKAQQELIKAIHHLFHLKRHASKSTCEISIGKSKAKTIWGVKEEHLDALTPVQQPKEKKFPKFLLSDVIEVAEAHHGSFLEVAPTSFRFMDYCGDGSGGSSSSRSGGVTIVGSGGTTTTTCVTKQGNSNISTRPVLGTIYGKEESSNPTISSLSSSTSPKKKNILTKKTLLKRLTDETDIAYYNHHLQTTIQTMLSNTPTQQLHAALSASFSQTKTEIQNSVNTIAEKEVELQRLVQRKKKEILGLKVDLVVVRNKGIVFEEFLRGLVPPQDAHQFSNDEDDEDDEDVEEEKKILVDVEEKDNESISSVQRLLANEEDDEEEEGQEQEYSLASPTKKSKRVVSHDESNPFATTPPLPSTILMNSYLNGAHQPHHHNIPGSAESEESIVAQQLLAVGNVSTLEDSDFIFD